MIEWFYFEIDEVVRILLACLGIFIGVMIITRLAGLRTFAKMSSMDFASTIAIGSVIAAVIMNDNQSVGKGVFAIAIIVCIQIGSSLLQKQNKWIKKLISNKPIELMRQGKISDENLKQAKVSRCDLMAKLREANALHLDNVISVVLETTGDISVLHSDSSNTVSEQIMDDVQRIIL